MTIETELCLLTLNTWITIQRLYSDTFVLPFHVTIPFPDTNLLSQKICLDIPYQSKIENMY